MADNKCRIRYEDLEDYLGIKADGDSGGLHTAEHLAMMITYELLMFSPYPSQFTSTVIEDSSFLSRSIPQ